MSQADDYGRTNRNITEPIRLKKFEEKFDSIAGVELHPDMPEADLVSIINEDLETNRSQFDELLRIKRNNFQYYRGYQARKNQSSSSRSHTSRPDVNRIFGSIETKVAIITAETPEPTVKVYPEGTNKARRLKNKLNTILIDLWDFYVKMQQIMERDLRSYFLGRICVLHYGFDEKKGRPFTEVVNLESLRFDITAPSLQESPYIAHYIEEPITSVVAKFPKKRKELLKKLGLERAKRGSKGVDKFNTRSKITYVRYWADYYENDEKKVMVVHKYNNVILGVEGNPIWNESGKNHHDSPNKPYIPMHSISTGNSVIDDTSEVEQAIPLQDSINRRKRQIDRNADMANGILVGTARGISSKDWAKISPETRKVYLDSDIENPSAAFGIVTGQPFNPGVFNDMQDSKAEFDNIMGTHDTTRGEKTRTETLGGQALRREADLGRLDLTSRSYEQVAEDWYNGMIQLMYMHDFNKMPMISDPRNETPDERAEKVKGLIPIDDRSNYINKKDLQEFTIVCVIRRGTSLPMNPAAIRNDAITLRQTGSIDTQTFIEMYNGEMPKDPRTVAMRSFLEQTEPLRLYPELDERGIDFEAISHIEQIIGAKDAEEETAATRLVFTNAEDVEALSSHLNTHSAYISGAEVDEALPTYQSLTDNQKRAIMRHVAIEQGILNMFLREQQLQTPEITPQAAEAAPTPEITPQVPLV